MGKVIPKPPQPSPATVISAEAQGAPPGPLQLKARELVERLRVAEEQFDLDELDRMARRHARPPASGSPEALEALALLARAAPELFQRTEVNLEPRRLESMADRGRALSLLNTTVIRFADLVEDSHLEHGDEVVELLTVGWARAQALPADRLEQDERLRTAVNILKSYHQRVIDEGAHRIPAKVEAEAKKKK